MPSHNDAIAPGAVVRLPAYTSTAVADDLRVQLVMATDGTADVVIDAGQVESIGQAGLQLLIATRRETERNGQLLTIADPGEGFVRRVTDCLLADAIGLEVPLHAAQSEPGSETEREIGEEG